MGRPVQIQRVPAEVTYPLRQQVLRPHRGIDSVRFDGDDDPRTAVYASLTEDGEVVGTATALPEPCPWRPDEPAAWRLRGMATAEGARGLGVGTALLAAVVDHVTAAGGGLLWCKARTPARRFYARAGFREYGEEWVDPEIGPHVAMWLDLERRPELRATSTGSASP